MDRTAWTAVVLCAIALVLWQVYVVKTTQVHRPVAASPSPIAALSPTPQTADAPQTTNSIGPSATPAATAVAQPSPSVAAFAEATETLSNGDVEVHVTNRGGGIAEVVLPNHLAEQERHVTLNGRDHIPIGAIISDPASPDLPEYKIVRQEDSVKMEFVSPDQVLVKKTISLPQSTEKKDNFIIELNVDLANNGTKPFVSPGYYLALGSAAPMHPRDLPTYTRAAWCVNGTSKGVDAGWFNESSGFLGVAGARAARPLFQEHLSGAEWVAVSNQFFATLIAPLTGKSDGVWAKRFEIDPALKLSGIEGAMHMPGFSIPPGQSTNWRFQIYAGPKIYHRLARLDHNEAEVMNFGVFKIVSQFLLNFLNLIHSYVRDYGVAILILTTIIRIVLWPLQSKANQSMRKTAVLGPKMQELREKYKDDPTRMNQEVMKMYKQYGINPVGGCLPMLIQIPIFFGLYTMLGQAVELRNEKFLWVKDLSQPDTVGHLPILGWPINIIPLCMALTQIWLMQMTPKTGDPTQRRVMMFMPLIFLFICYNFAAALALYYTAQNLFSILQFYQNKKQPMPVLEKVAPPGKAKR